MIRRILLVATTSLVVAQAVPAQQTDATEALCHVKAEGEVIHIAICSERGADDVMGQEGRRICDGDVPCGVWFWLSAEDAPEVAPANHDGLTQAEVTSSMGVYVEEDKMFIRIDVD